MTLTSQDREMIKTVLGRNPSIVEETIFDTMWSEHCSYKSTKRILKKYLPTKGSEVALGIGEDSGIIRFAQHDGKQYCIAISHESHNHPSQILPIEGAATGVGGVVRDVYCMGADVVGVLNSLHFGINKTGNTPIVDEIAEKVVLGVSDYANPLGVPVLGGETLFHDSYNDNCLVNVAALGLVTEDQIIHSYVPKEARDMSYDIILIGKSTDATGFGGAAFSSETLDSENDHANLGAVQVHDPFLKRVLVEALKVLFQKLREEEIVAGFKDLGAGGISCATSEIAAAGGFGVTIDLDKVNTAIYDLKPEVIACSETQERFCLAVPQYFSETVLELFNKTFALPELYKNAGAAVIGQVTRDTTYKIMHKKTVVCELPIQAITTEVQAHRESAPREIDRVTKANPLQLQADDIRKTAIDLLQLPNNKSKRYVYRYFDNAVRGHTVMYPGEADAVVVTPIDGCDVGLTASMDSNLYGKIDPYTSGAYAVAEAIRNVVCHGARPIALTDCLNYGNPEKPDVFFEFEEGVKGIADAAHAFSFIPEEAIPVISGNVSLYNESKQGNAVTPSPVIVVIGKLESYKTCRPYQLFDADQHLILIGNRYPEFGGTQIQNLYPDLPNVAPQVRFQMEHQLNLAIHDAMNKTVLTACHDIAMGGLWQTLCEMCLGERGLFKVGMQLDLSAQEDLFTALFSENGGYVVAIHSEYLSQFRSDLDAQQVQYFEIGKTVADPAITIKHQQTQLKWQLSEIEAAWNCSM